MLFNSIIFLLFLPIVFLCYWFVFKKNTIQNFFIIIASYVFYGWWNWKFLFLIFLTTLSCYLAGLTISRTENKNLQKWICGLNIFFNVSILCVFKYFNFFLSNLQILLSQFGYQLDWFTIDILLPVGISFYTFQAISYPIDVLRNNGNVTSDFIAFTAYISFFPQLVAGPIERSTQLLPQFLNTRHFDYNNSVNGLRQMLWGFFKKMVIADNCAFLVNQIFQQYEACQSYELIIGAVLFSFQIYGDFSGYSDIAIGTAKLFGIRLSQNFHYPYFSRTIMEFWKRWHISLTSWLRDYVYIPLGGNRCSELRHSVNILIVFLISGLWHGANWTFVIWGMYNGILLILEVIILKKCSYVIEGKRYLASFKRFLSVIFTFSLVTLGWIIFRSENVIAAWHYIGGCLHLWSGFHTEIIQEYEILFAYTVLMILFMLLTEWISRNKSFGLEFMESKPKVIQWIGYLSICCLIGVLTVQQTEFIYFKF